MRKVVFLMHVSLDGFVAGPKGEMNWIHVDDEIFELANALTRKADTALYGRNTYYLMENYWPTAAEQPGASKHDIEHSHWANKATKLVFSKTLKTVNWPGTRIVQGNEKEEIETLKRQPGKNLLLLGSPTLSQSLMRHNLIDEYYLTINPVVLGEGIPLFSGLLQRMDLELVNTHRYRSGVVMLHYKTRR